MNEEEIQKILIDHKTREINLVEATTKLQSLILKARLDEEEKAYFGWSEDHAEFEVWNENRIAELKTLNTKIGGSDA